METGEINKPATLTNVLHLCQTSLWLYRYFYLSIFQSKHNWRWRLWNQTERGPKEIGMLMLAKGRQRVKSSPPQQCALCSPWKTIATWSSRGNDIWGKYVALQPEETMSKKKNRHEVTDLIKGEKYTEQGDGNTAGGEGAPWEAQDTEVGFCCFFDGNQELKWVLPFIKAPLQWTQNPDTWRSTPSPAARQWEALKQTATPCHMGHQDALPQTTGRKGGGWGWWNEASKKELDYQSLAFRPWAGVFTVFHNYVLNTYCVINGNITACDVALT